MAAITFDTLKFVEKLKAAGISDAQAKAEKNSFSCFISIAKAIELEQKINDAT